MEELFSVAAVGDVCVDRDDPGASLRSVRSLFEGADIRFGNCECAFGDPARRQGGAVVDPMNVAAFAEFDLLSVANNHILDAGPDRLTENLDALRDSGVRCAGAGADIDEAWAPAVVERRCRTTALVASASVFPFGAEATLARPGLAPLRTHNHFVDARRHWLPGYLPSSVRTIDDETDREQLREAIRTARRVADIVLASFHWGDHTREAVLTDHERRMAAFAIDSGADAVLGHHHHTLRGIDFHKRRPILYGLGHFVFDLPVSDGRPDAPAGAAWVLDEERDHVERLRRRQADGQR